MITRKDFITNCQYMRKLLQVENSIYGRIAEKNFNTNMTIICIENSQQKYTKKYQSLGKHIGLYECSNSQLK